MTEAKLGEIERATERFTAENLERFDPFDWEHFDNIGVLRKTFEELSLYLYVSNKCNSDGDMYPFLVERVNDPRFSKLILRSPKYFRHFSFACMVAKLNGDLGATTEEAIDHAIRSQSLWGEERRPHELIDLIFQAHLWGYDDHGHELDGVVQTSNIVNPPHIVTSDLKECYALTHNVMMLTNFGKKHPGLKEAPLPFDLETSIKGNLIKNLAKGDADIVSELVVAGVLQESIPPHLVNYVIEWISETMIQDGHVSGPRSEGPDPAAGNLPDISMQNVDPTMEHWLKNYHTNLVVGIMTHILRTQWSHREELGSEISLESEELQSIRRLGNGLVELEKYNLENALEILGTIDDEIVRQYADVYVRAAAYLQEHYAGDGTYGYWVDERGLCESKGIDADFDEAYVDPLVENADAQLGNIRDKLVLLRE